MDDRGTTIKKGTIIRKKDGDLYKLFKVCLESIKYPLLKVNFFFSAVAKMLSLQPSFL
jgi:hypothetical protein